MAPALNPTPLDWRWEYRRGLRTLRQTLGHCTCWGIVLLWPGRDHGQPFLRERDLAVDTMTP